MPFRHTDDLAIWQIAILHCGASLEDAALNVCRMGPGN